MNQEAFQDEVIDRLARIETKQDTTNGRVNKLEAQVRSLELTRANHSGVSRLLLAALSGGTGLLGAGIGGLVEYLLRR